MRIVFTTDEDAVVVEDETEAPPAGMRAAKVEEESIMGTPPAAVGEDDEECVASTPPPPGVLGVAGLVGNILCKAMECVLVAASLLLICGRSSTKQNEWSNSEDPEQNKKTGSGVLCWVVLS